MHWAEHDTEHLDRIGGCGTYEWRVAENRLTWSAGLVQLYGLDRAPTAEEGFTRLVHPDDRMRVEAETSCFLERGGSYEHEFRIVRPDGEVRHIHDRGAIERAADGTPLVLRGLNVDVTRERQAQASRHDARLNTAPGVGFYEFDIARGRSWWSGEMFRILDLDRAEAVDPDAVTRARVVKEDQARLRALQEAASRRLGPFEIEYRIRRRDGKIRWLRDRGETLGPLDPVTGLAWQVKGTVMDITEQRSDAPGTPAGSETFRQVIEAAPFGICVIDAEFRLIQVSAGAAPVFAGIEPLIGRDLGELLRIIWPEPFASEAIAQFRRTLETGEPYHASATRERRHDRDAVETYEWKLEQIHLPDGRPGVVCYFYDLTARATQEAELRENEERLELAYEAAGMGAWDLDLTTGGAIWTPQLYALLGLDPDRPASSELFFEHVHPDDRDQLRAAFERAIETGGIFEAGFRIRRADGALRHVAGRGRIVARQAGRPVRMIGVNFDITDRRRMERKVRDNERQLRLILDNAVAFIGVLDLDGTLREANATALKAGGLSRKEVIGKPFWETYWWSHDPEVAERLRGAVATAARGEAVRYDEVVRMRGESRMTIDVLLSPIFDDDGGVRQIVASGFDITEREKAMSHVQLLMREINHRSKNTIALIQAIARQIWRATPEDFFPRFESRLRALAAAHDLLVNDDWDGALLEDLVRAQLAHFGDLIGTRIHLSGPRVGVTADAAQALGMAFHELATNAGKYGALANEEGQIDIAWSVDGEAEEGGILTLSWTERGGPPVAAPERKGFGSIVLDAIVRSTLAGEVEIAYPPEGLRWRLTCSDKCLLS
ncbi:PAS domain-containing protein [Tranquillimonas alkanivorans]|uniref:histidine kinase n=1 Tax=Tranquillimonas alkanivorans TaxID=441119 RepID=A0A1I5U8V0_9RHOB|nr:PAS domain-containing protein [Tranquillimonas alkanivorans]SFP91377.1 PAS domain S-box-containing protein [Tranquillimonas alkanivorans]